MEREILPKSDIVIPMPECKEPRDIQKELIESETLGYNLAIKDIQDIVKHQIELCDDGINNLTERKNALFNINNKIDVLEHKRALRN